jgi:hypothetical protein
MIRIVYIIVMSLFVLLTNTPAFSQIVRLNASVEKDSLLIGEQTGFNITIVKEKDVKLRFPVLSDTLAKNIEIIQISQIDTFIKGEEITLTQRYLITSFDTGYFSIPPFPFAFEFGNVADTIYSRPLSLRIDKPTVDLDAEFRDIKAPVNTPLNIREIMPYAGISLFGLALLVLLFMLIRKIKNRDKPVLIEKEYIPPYIIALEELEKMLNEKSWEKESIKEFYTRLSGIVRTYLENQFDVPAMESTTPVILATFAESYGKNKDIILKLDELLQFSDLVKFAKEAPPPDENKRNIDKAMVFVELTKPQEIQKVEGN